MTLSEILFAVSLVFGVSAILLARLRIVSMSNAWLDNALGWCALVAWIYIPFFIVWRWV